MKITCNIIEDLLPLYIDDMVSEDSRQLVEEHLKECAACRKMLDEMKKEISRAMEIIDRGDDFFEIVPKGHSKATAIEMILRRFGLEREDAWVFGDSMNDLPMFQYALNKVLMGKHDRGLEPYATFVTKTVEEDGIAYAMETLGLI